MCGARRDRSVGAMKITRLLPLAVVLALAVWPGAGQAASRTQTIKVFDKPVSIKVIHPDGTVVSHEPLPEPQAGDVLEVNSIEFVGNHVHHAKRATMSAHLTCTFGAAGTEPACVSYVAVGGSMLIFKGNELTDGTGIYQGATGRVVSMKEQADNASDIVAKIHLR